MLRQTGEIRHALILSQDQSVPPSPQHQLIDPKLSPKVQQGLQHWLRRGNPQ